MSEIIIVADLGHFKAFRFLPDPVGLGSPSLETIESHDFAESRSKASDRFSDDIGRYRRSEGNEWMTAGYGELHDIELETEKRLIRKIAKDIST